MLPRKYGQEQSTRDSRRGNCITGQRVAIPSIPVRLRTHLPPDKGGMRGVKPPCFLSSNTTNPSQPPLVRGGARARTFARLLQDPFEFPSSPCNTLLSDSTLAFRVTRNPSRDDPQTSIVLTARADAATIDGTRIRTRSQGNIST